MLYTNTHIYVRRYICPGLTVELISTMRRNERKCSPQMLFAVRPTKFTVQPKRLLAPSSPNYVLLFAACHHGRPQLIMLLCELHSASFVPARLIRAGKKQTPRQAVPVMHLTIHGMVFVAEPLSLITEPMWLIAEPLRPIAVSVWLIAEPLWLIAKPLA